MHESREKELFGRKKRRTSKYKFTQERRGSRIFSLCFRYLFFQSRCRGCVLHEHLTHEGSLGCGGVISEANQMPSLWVAG